MIDIYSLILLYKLHKFVNDIYYVIRTFINIYLYEIQREGEKERMTERKRKKENQKD